jgi:hypothetical protein
VARKHYTIAPEPSKRSEEKAQFPNTLPRAPVEFEAIVQANGSHWRHDADAEPCTTPQVTKVKIISVVVDVAGIDEGYQAEQAAKTAADFKIKLEKGRPS